MANPLRKLGDGLLTTVTTLTSSASQTKFSSSIDLNATGADRIGDIAKLKLDVPTLSGTLTSTHTITYTVQDSADNSTFADVNTTTMKGFVYTGTDAAAVDSFWPIPDNIRRYVRLKIVSGAAAEDCSAVSVTFQVLV